MLNIRASYGINGNISLKNGPFLILGTSGYNNNTEGNANYIYSPPNNQLRWEKTTINNLGIDISVLNNRITTTIDLYNKKSTDLLADDKIDPIRGFNSLFKNVGTIINRGIELKINALIIDKVVSWNSSLGLAYNDNIVEKYSVNRPYFDSWISNTGVVAEGYGVDAIFAYKFAGLNDKGRPLAFDKNGNKVYLSDLKTDDIVYKGHYVNPYNLFITNNFKYKDFSLSVMLQGKFGGKYRKDCFNGANFTNRHFSERWQKLGDEKNTIYPVFDGYSTDRHNYPSGDMLIGNRDYVKVKDITLTYSIPEKLCNKIGLTGCKTYVQASNLYTFKGKDVAIDPETGGLPLSREFYIGLSFKLKN